MTGIITFWNHLRGYGFITTTTGESFFFHVSHFDKNTTPVLEGQVEFKIRPPIKVGKKSQAVGVRYIRQNSEGKEGDSGLEALAGKGGAQ